MQPVRQSPIPGPHLARSSEVRVPSLCDPASLSSRGRAFALCRPLSHLHHLDALGTNMSKPAIIPDTSVAGIAVDPRTLERVIPESRRPDGSYVHSAVHQHRLLIFDDYFAPQSHCPVDLYLWTHESHTHQRHTVPHPLDLQSSKTDQDSSGLHAPGGRPPLPRHASAAGGDDGPTQGAYHRLDTAADLHRS